MSAGGSKHLTTLITDFFFLLLLRELLTAGNLQPGAVVIKCESELMSKLYLQLVESKSVECKLKGE